MKFPFFKKNSLITLLVCCLFSCSSDLDFEQSNDFNIQPVFTTNLAYAELNAADFIKNGSEEFFFRYVSNVDFLNTSFVVEDLNKAEMYFRIKNTIPREYVYNVTLLDVNNVPIHAIPISVPAYNGKEILVEHTETFTGTNVAILTNTTHIVFSVLMRPGTPITETTSGRVEFSSSLTAYFDVK
jgi:hypothetical protein